MINAILIGVDKNLAFLEESMLELESLADANNIRTIFKVQQRLDKVNRLSYFGKGKVQELIEIVKEIDDISYIIANDELSFIQLKHLKEALEDFDILIIDRTSLILDIFESRAQSKAAILQVEIARRRYDLAHLVVQNENYDQQRGGGAINRGSGEKKIDLSRNQIKERISVLKHALIEIEKENEVRIKQRLKNGVFRVALVGYTNAGKSTIMNMLINHDNSKRVLEKDMLFATLDTSVRRVFLNNNREILLSDTVGFIDKLPHNLVHAFKSTLQEALDADLILHVVDYSNDNYLKHIDVTNKTLKSIGFDNEKIIYVYNKCDNVSDCEFPRYENDTVMLSARYQSSIGILKDVIESNLPFSDEFVKLVIPNTDYEVINNLAMMKSFNVISNCTDVTTVEVVLKKEDLPLYSHYRCDAK